MAQGKIRIRLKGYDHQQLDRSAQQIVDTAQRSGATITGPVPLPTEKNVYCVIRSPFKDKDSREHFEVRTHKRLIDIHQPDAEDDRPAHAARPSGRHRHRDQALMAKGILGRKLGMTQVFDPETGVVTSVTVIQAGPCPVVQVQTVDADGYDAVQLAFDAVAERKLTRPELGHLKRFGVGPHRHARRVPRRRSTARSRARPSRSRSSSRATRSRSPGSGSARASRARSSGTTSRSGPRSHGSHNVRKPGSIGASATPSRVFKGIKMAGRMGGKRVTQLGLTVHEVDAERNLLLVKGSVPGPKNGIVEVRGVDGRAEGTAARRRRREDEGRRLEEAIFGVEVKPHLVHEAVRAELNAHRAGTFATKSRGLVSGGRAKPWRQKGTGRARAGHDPRRAVHGRRPRLREGAADVRPEGEPQGREGRVPLGAREPRRARARSALLDAARFEEPSTKAARACSRPPGSPTPVVVVAERRRDERRQVVPQPRRASRSSRRPSSRSARVVWARSLLVSEAALPLVQAGGRSELDAERRSCSRRSCPRRATPARPTASTRSGAPRRAQDADAPGGRAALRRQRPAREHRQGAAEAEAPRDDQGRAPGLEEGDRAAPPGPDDRVSSKERSSDAASAGSSRRRPGRRFMSVSDFAEVTKSKPEKSLTEKLTKKGGRNNNGRITTRHQGGGHKRRYRVDRLQAPQGRRARRRSRRSSTTRTARPGSRCCTTPTASRRTSSRRPGCASARSSQSGARRRHQARQRAAAREHPDRHARPQRRAEAGQGRPDGALGRLGHPARRQGRRATRRCVSPRARCAACC